MYIRGSDFVIDGDNKPFSYLLCGGKVSISTIDSEQM